MIYHLYRLLLMVYVYLNLQDEVLDVFLSFGVLNSF